MTRQIKSYPFEVLIAGPSPSAVLADQVKSLDWRKRAAKRKGIISAAELSEVRAKIRALIGLRTHTRIRPSGPAAGEGELIQEKIVVFAPMPSANVIHQCSSAGSSPCR